VPPSVWHEITIPVIYVTTRKTTYPLSSPCSDNLLSKREAIPVQETYGKPEFFPKGAIAFFAAMLVGFGLIWLGMYALLVHRQLGL